jgi:hypothetical protein
MPNDKKMFWEGVTFYHVAGLLMLLVGAYLPNTDNLMSGAGFAFNGNLTQAAGFFAFFYELIKSWVKRK